MPENPNTIPEGNLETSAQVTPGKDRKRKGFILLTHAIMIFFTLGMAGLAVDAGTMYVNA